MQTENRPQASVGPRDLDILLRGLPTLGAIYRVVPDKKERERTDDEHVERCGPMPGEIYADEAHFGSFS